MSLPAIEDGLRGQSDRFRKFSWPILIVSAAMTIGLVADLAFVDTPSFHTDLSDFAPDSESADAHDRISCLLYTSPSPRDGLLSRMPSSA